MELIELKQKIQNKELDKLYIFYGEEYLIRNAYIDMICNLVKLPRTSVDTLDSIVNFLNNRSIFGSKIFIINNDTSILKNEKCWDILKNNVNNTLILIYNSIDERTTFYKQFKDRIIKFEKLNEEVLHKYIKNHCKDLSDDRIYKLLNRCEQDYGRALNVCKKINILSKVEDRPLNYVYDTLIKENQIPISVKSMEFELLDSMLYKDFSYSLFLYQLIKDGTSIIALLGLLYKNFRNLLIVQSCSVKKLDGIVQKTGLDKWSINNIIKYQNIYQVEELLYIIKRIREYEVGLKSGIYNEEDIIEGLIVDIYCNVRV